MTRRCCDCRWYEGSGRPQTCEHPTVREWCKLIVGERAPIGIDAPHARFQGDLCGIAGRWFEEKLRDEA